MSNIVENNDITNVGIDSEYLAKLELYNRITILNNENSENNIQGHYEVIAELAEELVYDPAEEDEEPIEDSDFEHVIEEHKVEQVEEPVAEVTEIVTKNEVIHEINENITQINSLLEPQNIIISMEASEIILPPEPTPADSVIIPKLVFIVPYRNRATQLEAFKEKMKIILEDYTKQDYIIHYIHQMDERVFNRGAMKNIGFLAVKNKYPNDYKNITLVFNDVDTMPVRKNLFHYHTVPGVVKHFFGFLHTLGGIVSIKAADFEKVNGFPNFWAWGYEDNLLQKRLENIGITIDRSIFYKLGDKNIIQRNEEITREVNQSEYDRYLRNTREGIYSIQNLDYTIDDESGFVNVKWFNTEYNPNVNTYRLHDLRQGPMPYDTKFGLMYNNRRIRRGQMRMGI